MNRSSWLLRGLKFLLFAVLFLAIVGQFFMILWNKLVPEIFNGPVISFWQGLGLLLLSRILFGGWGRGGAGWARRRNAWKQKIAGRMATMTPEEQEKFRQKMQSACGPAWMRRKFGEEPVTTSTEV